MSEITEWSLTHKSKNDNVKRTQETAKLIQVGYLCTLRESRTVARIIVLPMHPKVCRPMNNQMMADL